MIAIHRNPILAAELKRRTFLDLRTGAVLLLLLWGLSAFLATRLNHTQLLIPVAVTISVVYLLWLAFPLVVAIASAVWINKQRQSQHFQMLRQTDMSDQNITLGYSLVSLYRLRLPLLILNGLVPLLLLRPIPDGTGSFHFGMMGWFQVVFLLLLGLSACLLGAAAAVALSLSRGTAGVWLVGVVGFALALIGISRLTGVISDTSLPVWLISPGLAQPDFITLSLIVASLLLAWGFALLSWRQKAPQLLEGVVLVGLLILGGVRLFKAESLLMNPYLIERRVLVTLRVQGATIDHCFWNNVTCNEAGYIKSLDLSTYRMRSLSPEIRHLSSLTWLAFAANGLEELPPQIGQLSSLEWLIITNNDLRGVPPQIGQLTNLQHLNLQGNQLRSLPPQIGRLSSLETLNMRDNQLEELPPEIGQLAALQFMNLSSNRLGVLPAEIGQLTSLENLGLYSNSLTQLPAEIGGLTHLQILDLRGNQLTSLPSEVGQLVSLQELYLSNNHLTELPPEIGDLSNLEELHLSDNDLRKLPPDIENLVSLQQLDLQQNELRDLPPEIGALPNLRELNLRDNDVAELPSALTQLASLQMLFLWGNPQIELQPELCPLQANISAEAHLLADLEQRCI